jgi:hypothetical protein
VRKTRIADVEAIGYWGPVLLDVETQLDFGFTIDMAVLLLRRDVTPDTPLEPTIAGVTLYQDAYFLGYPKGYGVEVQAEGALAEGTLPFAKKCLIAAMRNEARPFWPAGAQQRRGNRTIRGGLDDRGGPTPPAPRQTGRACLGPPNV